MMKLNDKLDERIPVSPTEPGKRRALEMFRSMVDLQLGDSLPEMQEILLKQAEELLDTVERRDRRTP